MAVLEVALRMFGPFLPGAYRTGPLIEPDAALGWRHIPSAVTWFRRPEFTSRVETNAQGRLGPPVSDAPRPGLTRVVLLGDSFVGVTQMPYESSVAGILPTHAEGIEVVNEGVSGYGTDQEILALDRRTAALHADVAILVFTAANDVWNNDWTLESRQPTYVKPHFDIGDDGALVLVEPGSGSASLAERITALLGRSWLLTVIKTGIVDPLSTTAARDREHRRELLGVLEVPAGEWQHAWRITEALVQRFADRSRALGMRPLLVIAPDPCQVHDNLCAGRPELSGSSVPQEILGRAARAASLPSLDLLPAFRARGAQGTRLYHSADLHWDPAGQRLAAELIAATLPDLRRAGP